MTSRAPHRPDSGPAQSIGQRDARDHGSGPDGDGPAGDDDSTGDDSAGDDDSARPADTGDDDSARRAATLRLAAGAMIISFAPVFVRWISMAPTTSAFYRTLIGGVALAALVLARRERVRAPRRAMVALVAAGFAFALDLALWHRAIAYIGPGLATLLGNFQAVVLAIVGVAVLGERLRVATAVAIAAALAGLALIVGFDWSVLSAEYRLGFVLGLATAVAYAGYIVALRAARAADPGASPARDLAIASLVACVFLGLGAVIEHGAIARPGPSDAGLLVAYATVAQVIGWVIISGALPHVPASRVGLILLLQPALVLVWDTLIFARSFTARELAGAATVLVAIYFGSRPGSHPKPRPHTRADAAQAKSAE